MMPRVHLHEVSTEDVARVARWLEDDEVCSRWLGTLESGEPMHLDYLPREMMGAPAEKWKKVFHDPHRRILSLYTAEGEHIGEAHLALQDFLGWAELAFFIGRKDLCRQGYGTASLYNLLDLVFNGLCLRRAWANVPVFNEPGLKLLKRAGFVREGRLRQSWPRGGRYYDSFIMGLLAAEFRTPQMWEEEAAVAISEWGYWGW
ncbi:MAG: GNAT family protein [Dehalococcoidia bacterium]